MCETEKRRRVGLLVCVCERESEREEFVCEREKRRRVGLLVCV